MSLLKSIYGMNNTGKLFADEVTEWVLEAGFIQSQCQMSINYMYVPDEKKLLFYLILIIVSIVINMKLLDNGLWKL